MEKSSVLFLILILTTFTPVELFACGGVLDQAHYFVPLGLTVLAFITTLFKSSFLDKKSTVSIKEIKYARNISIFSLIVTLLYIVSGLLVSSFCLPSGEERYVNKIIGWTTITVLLSSILGTVFSIIINRIKTTKNTIARLVWVPILVIEIAIITALLMLTVFRPNYFPSPYVQDVPSQFEAGSI